MAGKCKTATQMIALTILLLQQPVKGPLLLAPPLPPLFSAIGKSLMLFSTVLTVTSGSGYLSAAWPALMGESIDSNGKKTP
jgi:phosphatidylglycerophosphate synthase